MANNRTITHLGIDADGCVLYPLKYDVLIVYSMIKTHDIFKKYAEKSSLSEKDQQHINQIISDLIANLKTLDFTHLKLSDFQNDLIRLEAFEMYYRNNELINPAFKRFSSITNVIAAQMKANFFSYLKKVSPTSLQLILDTVFARVIPAFVEIAKKYINTDNAQQVFVASMSARNSYKYDQYCVDINSTQHSFVDLERLPTLIAKEIGANVSVELNKILLSDFINSTGITYPVGTIFNQALITIRQNDDKFKQLVTYHDVTKFLYIYLYAHHAVTCDPDAHHILRFKDDVKDKILDPLNAVIRKYMQLLPAGFELRLHEHYHDDEQPFTHDYDVIIGTGEVDYNYAKNISLIVECAGYDPKIVGTSINIANNLLMPTMSGKNRVEDFLERRQTKVQNKEVGALAKQSFLSKSNVDTSAPSSAASSAVQKIEVKL